MSNEKVMWHSVVLVFLLLMVCIVWHREREYDEFKICAEAGGSTLSRRHGVTCRLPGETAVWDSKK